MNSLFRLPSVSIRLILLSLTFGLFISATRQSAADESSANDDIQRVADRIDSFIGDRLKSEHVEAAGLADDAEFLRRVWLDIGGKIPPTADVIDFLEDDSPDKRQQAVHDLLDGPNYVLNFTSFWRSVMLPEVDSNFSIRFLTPGFEAWLRQQLIEDNSYDELVRELLTTSFDSNSQMQLYNNSGSANSLGFFQAKENKPENLAAATSRMFLGVRIECAQCHDHPFDHWKRDEFWGFAAFYSTISRPRGRSGNGFTAAIRELFDKRKLKIPDSDQLVSPTFLDGESPQIPASTSPREKLADWILRDDNPYFARTVANRIWGHFFGIGIVDPVDDFSESNPPSHPELLDFLAKEIAAHNYDLKFLMKAITRSQTYQRTSRQFTGDDAPPERLFAQMPIKGLTAEQLYDSIIQAVGLPSEFNPSMGFSFQLTGRNQFVNEFADSASAPTERQKSVLQALAIMNGQMIGDATQWKSSVTLRSVLEYPGFDSRRRIETLFLATLSRKPTSEELDRFIDYLGDTKDNPNLKDFPMSDLAYRDAMSDVFWALLNSNEFSLNH